MAEDLVDNLNTYNEQLKQVEAALTNDPSDAELLKLKKDLVEVIELTNDLIRAQAPAASSQDTSEVQEPIRDWEVGDKCSALWAEDGQFYNALVDEITSDGQVMVHFIGFKSAEVTRLCLLRDPLPEEAEDEEGAESSSKFGRKSGRNQQEYLKRKKQKKVQRFKEMEEVREQEKSKWQQFNSKVKKKKNIKGYTKSSIFKTPEAVNGKVGVGTCGIGGKPMTSYTTADKWKRGV